MRLAGSIWTIVTVCTRLVLTRVLKLIQARCFVDGKMVFGICYFHKWRLDLLLCPATTLMHSAVEKLDSDLLWRTVTAITIRFGLLALFRSIGRYRCGSSSLPPVHYSVGPQHLELFQPHFPPSIPVSMSRPRYFPDAPIPMRNIRYPRFVYCAHSR